MKSLFKGNLYPLLHLALPLVLTGLLQSAVFFFNTLFLAKLGPDALAASALVGGLFSTFAVALFGLLSSINILVAHRHGVNDKAGIAFVMRDGVWLACGLAIPSFALFWNMPSIFLLFGQHPSLVQLATSYLHALAWGLLPDFTIIAILELIIGLGHTRLILSFSLLTASLHLFFSAAFIFGLCGLPAMGIAGAGWGTTISYWIELAVLVICMCFSKKYKPYFRQLLTFTKPKHIAELFRLGIPIGIMYCVEVAFFFILTLLMGTFGTVVLAASQITLQYIGTLLSVVFSMAQAITVRVSYLIGKKDFVAAKYSSIAGVTMATVFGSVTALIFCFFPELLMSVDIDITSPENAHIINITKSLFLIGAIFQIAESLRIGLFGVLRGLKDTQFTLITSIVAFWAVALPAGYGIMHTGLAEQGLWWGMVLGAICGAGMLYHRSNAKINVVQVDAPSTAPKFVHSSPAV